MLVLDEPVANLDPLARRDFLRDAARTRERFMKDLDAVISSINRCTFDVLQRAHLAIDGMKGIPAIESFLLARIHFAERDLARRLPRWQNPRNRALIDAAYASL